MKAGTTVVAAETMEITGANGVRNFNPEVVAEVEKEEITAATTAEVKEEITVVAATVVVREGTIAVAVTTRTTAVNSTTAKDLINRSVQFKILKADQV